MGSADGAKWHPIPSVVCRDAVMGRTQPPPSLHNARRAKDGLVDDGVEVN